MPAQIAAGYCGEPTVGPIDDSKHARYGTIDWLFRHYKTEEAYTEKVSERSRPDYERIMQMICDTLDKKGWRIGDHMVREVTPRGAIEIYRKIIKGADGERLRQGEKVVGLCRKVWNVMRPLYPDVFPRPTSEGVVNPWMSVVLKRRVKKKKHAVTREEVYKFAWGCIEKGRPEPAAVAVICFEWLQRPENVVAGITDGQGRALSGHKTTQAYKGYAKETMQRALAATRKRHAHLLTQRQLEQEAQAKAEGGEQISTEFRNKGAGTFRNGHQKRRENKSILAAISKA